MHITHTTCIHLSVEYPAQSIITTQAQIIEKKIYVNGMRDNPRVYRYVTTGVLQDVGVITMQIFICREPCISCKCVLSFLR